MSRLPTVVLSTDGSSSTLSPESPLSLSFAAISKEPSFWNWLSLASFLSFFEGAGGTYIDKGFPTPLRSWDLAYHGRVIFEKTHSGKSPIRTRLHLRLVLLEVSDLRIIICDLR